LSTILIIDDSESQRDAIRDVLTADCGFDVILEASDGISGLKLLLAEKIDLILCDLELPGLDGEKLLRIKENNPGGPDVPFVFLTGTTNLDRRARLLDGGACDAIAKPFHPADLLARLKLHLKVRRLQAELREKNEALERLSAIDVLTDLCTRRALFERLEVEFRRARRYSTPMAVLMIDIDHFKRVNDQYGHPGGDVVLRGVAQLLSEQLRATDLAGRYGGEEMAVAMQADLPGARLVAERYRQAVEEAVFQSPDGRDVQVTVSIGIGELEEGMESADQVLEHADRALYRAKDGGRNRVEV
jgi:diguanylate cyclase (GGDEF)-like protein